MEKNKYKATSQWFQAIISLCVLSCIYMSRGYFAADAVEPMGPSTPPVMWTQAQYWDGDNTGFASGHTQISKRAATASPDTEGVVYDQNGIKVSFFRDTDTKNIEKQIQSDLPRFYTQTDTGTLLVEGDISSWRIAGILENIQSS